MNPIRIGLVLAALFGVLPAQDDLRDRLILRNGKEVVGRLIERYGGEDLLMVQGGKRIRVPRADVDRMELVADAVREFGERRRTMRGSARAQWFLVQWAESRGLRGLARAQAMAIVLADDGHEEAHRYLGHEPSAKGWLWEHRGKKWLRDKLEEQLHKQPIEVPGERFVVRCDGGLTEGVHALLDLETLGAAWFAQFGEALHLHDFQKPLRIDIARNVDEFEKWGFRPVPYYVPEPHGDVGRTFYAGPSPTRPERLFFVGMQGLLYRTMIGDGNRQDDRDRTVPWLEVGLGSWIEARMQGPAGLAAFGSQQGENLVALQALARTPRLHHLIVQPMYGGFYLADDTPTAANWATSHMLVGWLLEGVEPPERRAAFLAYVRGALADGKGAGSSFFDASLGARIEDLEAPWRAWVGARSRE
ncbi:MAG: hypothetical protein RL398_3034 [Planctomycetota bacterium]|jgi:hypothetical protein